MKKAEEERLKAEADMKKAEKEKCNDSYKW